METLGRVPGNRLEALEGDRGGQHSVRINVQYQICFRWENGDVYEVEITDCHPGEVLRMELRYDLEIKKMEVGRQIEDEVEPLATA